jgi:putative MFS transporter
VALIGASGALAVWWLRLGVPESPRWLAGMAGTKRPKRLSENWKRMLCAIWVRLCRNRAR